MLLADTVHLQYLSLLPWTLLLAQPWALHTALPVPSTPTLSWSTPCYFSPVFLLNPFFRFPGLPVLIASFWISVKKPKSKATKLWLALEQWLSSFVMQGDLFLKREDSFLSTKFSGPVIQSRMRLLGFQRRGDHFHTVTFWQRQEAFSGGGGGSLFLVWFVFFFNTGTDLGNWKQRWKNCVSGSL